MEFTVDQALQKGIQAHKAGKLQEADGYYTAILKANPKHPDANHNMGILAIDLGRFELALPFLKTALEVNSSIDQYWFSYVGALIKLDRVAEAKVVFDQAKSKGVEGRDFDQIELELKSSSFEAESNANEDIPIEANILDEFKLDKALKLAKNKVKDGLTNEAKKIYQDILKKFPKNKKASDGIKTLASKTLATNTGIQEPPKEQLTSLLTLYNQQKLQQVFNEAQILTKRYTKSSTLLNLMGASAAQLGKLDEAVLAFQKALSIKPNDAQAYYNMGNALKDQEKLEEAIDAYRKALSIKPDYADAYVNMGNVLTDQEKLEDAIEAYNRALSNEPDNAEAHYNMGNALKDQEKLEEAIDAYRKALSIKPDYADAYVNMGNVLTDQEKLEDAIEAYNGALSNEPDNAEAYYNIGNALKDQEKLGEAIEAYDKALSVKPDYADAHFNLSLIKKYEENDDQIIQAQKLYELENLSKDARCSLAFSLAKMYEDVGKLDQAFSYLFEGNALRKNLLNYSINQDIEFFKRLKETQPHFLINSKKIKESSIKTNPIFILGMPRSGTSLVEQIISSHAKVLGAGELKYISKFGEKLAVDPTSINVSAISEFRQKYLSEVSKLSYEKNFVTDKMPQNFHFIPLICAAFPEAKIVHIKRSAAATCWSNYKQYFSAEGLGYSYDLKDVVSYYTLYIDLMDLWQSEYTDRIYNLNYEELTANQESETRKLIDNLGLDWDEACLSPHKNRRIVRTASQQQVKKKVYQGSSEAWRKYEPYLNGAFNSLPSS